MKGLTVLWDENERNAVQSAIENLFRLKGYRMIDKTLTETAAVFVENLSQTGLPPNAVLSGIHKLKFERIGKIDIADIVEASEEHLESTEPVRVECIYCGGRGIVSLKDENKLEYALACICLNGDSYASKGHVRWNGEREQQIPMRLVTAHWWEDYHGLFKKVSNEI